MSNGHLNHATRLAPSGASLNRASAVNYLLDVVKPLIIDFIETADATAPARYVNGYEEGKSGDVRQGLVQLFPPEILRESLNLCLPLQGQGANGLMQAIKVIMDHSVNTWNQGYLDKLCASTDAVGLVSELVIATLNTNLHVYRVSPALTVVEKTTARALAALFGFSSSHAGGISCQGGSASNLTSLCVARNILGHETKTKGVGSRHYAIFTSDQSHYSIRKAAMVCGLGTESTVIIPSDAGGSMDVNALRGAIVEAIAQGQLPLYVNATAGTTVLGAYDPIRAISAVCREYGMWLHVDGSYGGALIFSPTHSHKLDGSELANSVTISPHKLLGVPTTCSFLLTNDLRQFREANSTEAEYLFHQQSTSEEEWDLANLTLQCGRRADSLKLALSWIYHGQDGLRTMIDRGLTASTLLAEIIHSHVDFGLVSQRPPPSMQVCFYYLRGLATPFDWGENSRRTRAMIDKLVSRGIMVDFAPGPHGQMFRVALNSQTLLETVESLVARLVEVGQEV